jgi:MFS family permease
MQQNCLKPTLLIIVNQSEPSAKPVPLPVESDDVLTEEARGYRAQLQGRLWLWAPCMVIGFIASGMDESIQTAANALIGAEFNALDRISWLGTGWFVGVITGYPLWCLSCDIVGRKSPIVLYHASYLLGLLLSGFATSFPMLSMLLLFPSFESFDHWSFFKLLAVRSKGWAPLALCVSSQSSLPIRLSFSVVDISRLL